MNTEQEVLKPCPFCGGTNIALLNGGLGNRFVHCDDCRATTDDGSEERAIAAWNRRSPPAVAAGGVTIDPELLAKQSTIEPGIAAAVYPNRSKLYSDFSGGVTEEMVNAALALLAAEDARQDKLHELLETIREQIRLEVAPEHRPDGLMVNIQNAVYAMRGRTRLMNDAALTAALAVRDEGIREGWQPIKTAPRGRKIDLWLWNVADDGAPFDGFRFPDVELLGPAPHPFKYWDDEAEPKIFHPDENGQFVSHWRELPTSPTPPSRGEGE